MRILGTILALLYAGVLLYGLCKQKAKSLWEVFMAAGCLLVLLYVFINLVWCKNLMAMILAGMVAISAGALLNGINRHNVHISHHVIRLVVETAIVLLCWLGK